MRQAATGLAELGVRGLSEGPSGKSAERVEDDGLVTPSSTSSSSEDEDDYRMEEDGLGVRLLEQAWEQSVVGFETAAARGGGGEDAADDEADDAEDGAVQGVHAASLRMRTYAKPRWLAFAEDVAVSRLPLVVVLFTRVTVENNTSLDVDVRAVGAAGTVGSAPAFAFVRVPHGDAAMLPPFDADSLEIRVSTARDETDPAAWSVPFGLHVGTVGEIRCFAAHEAESAADDQQQQRRRRRRQLRFAVEVVANPADPTHSVVVRLAPFYVLHNSLGVDVLVRQSNAPDNAVLVRSSSSAPLDFVDVDGSGDIEDDELLVRVSVPGSFGDSGAVRVNTVGEHLLLCRTVVEEDVVEVDDTNAAVALVGASSVAVALAAAVAGWYCVGVQIVLDGAGVAVRLVPPHTSQALRYRISNTCATAHVGVVQPDVACPFRLFVAPGAASEYVFAEPVTGEPELRVAVFARSGDARPAVVDVVDVSSSSSSSSSTSPSSSSVFLLGSGWAVTTNVVRGVDRSSLRCSLSVVGGGDEGEDDNSAVVDALWMDVVVSDSVAPEHVSAAAAASSSSSSGVD